MQLIELANNAWSEIQNIIEIWNIPYASNNYSAFGFGLDAPESGTRCPDPNYRATTKLTGYFLGSYEHTLLIMIKQTN